VQDKMDHETNVDLHQLQPLNSRSHGTGWR
jgi:hypothetical protein